jgi:hypothetical protein
MMCVGECLWTLAFVLCFDKKLEAAEHQFLLVKINELNNRADYVRELLAKIGNKLGFTSFDNESL